VYKIFGTTRNEIYPFLNWGASPISCLKLIGELTLVAQPIFFTIIFSLICLKQFIRRRCSKGDETRAKWDDLVDDKRQEQMFSLESNNYSLLPESDI
jgi:hypothetical protein